MNTKIDTYITKDSRTFTVRQPNETEARNIIDYAKILFASTDQVLTTPEEYKITLEDQKVWINNSLQNPDSIILVAELNNEIVGLLDFAAKPKKKQNHTGEFGVSVHPHFQGQNIGRQLINTLLNWAKENKQIEKVFLNVLDTNKNALKLYKELGFIEEGRQIKAIKQPSEEYVDLIQMYISTK